MNTLDCNQDAMAGFSASDCSPSSPIQKWKVMPTSITRQSLLVLPDPGYHTPKISLQMDTELAHVLSHFANVLPQLIEAVRRQCADTYHPDLLEALKIAEGKMENSKIIDGDEPPQTTDNNKNVNGSSPFAASNS